MIDLGTIIRELFAPDNIPQGYDAEAITMAEQTLDCRLPAVLREYYTTFGRNETLNATHNRLLPPHEIYYTRSGHLVFYEENQAVAVWGIDKKDLHQDDPPVYGSYDTAREDWFEDSGSTTRFLLSMIFVQAALGGLRYRAFVQKVTPEMRAIIEQNWQEQNGITNQYLRFFTRDHREILMVTTDEEGKPNGLYIASNDKERYQQMTDVIINISWDDRCEED